MAINERRERDEIRAEVGKVVEQIKNGSGPTAEEVSFFLKVDPSFSTLIIATAKAWIYREKVDSFLEQLRTGNLEGVEPIGSLEGSRST